MADILAQIWTFDKLGHLFGDYNPKQPVSEAVDQAQRLKDGPISPGELYFVAEEGQPPPVAIDKIPCQSCRERLR